MTSTIGFPLYLLLDPDFNLPRNLASEILFTTAEAGEAGEAEEVGAAARSRLSAGVAYWPRRYLVSVALGALQGPMNILSLIGGVSPRGPPQGQTLRALLIRGTSVLH